MRPRRNFRPMVTDPLEERIPPATATPTTTSNPKSLSEMIDSMLQGFLGTQNKTPSSAPFVRQRDELHIEVYTPHKKVARLTKPHGKLAAAHRLAR